MLNVNSLDIIWSCLLLLIWIKSAIKKTFVAVISLFKYDVLRKFWKSKFWNCGKYKWSGYLNEIAYSPQACNFTKKETPAKVFSSKFCEMSENLRIPHLKRNETKCLLLLIEFSSLSESNTTLKIGITITWSFTLRYNIIMLLEEGII